MFFGKILLAVVFALLLASCGGAGGTSQNNVDCYSHTSCGNCEAAQSCSWCWTDSFKGECMGGGAGTYYSCSYYDVGYPRYENTEPACSAPCTAFNSSCNTCISKTRNCVWCKNTRQCISRVNTGNHSNSHCPGPSTNWVDSDDIDASCSN